MSSIILLEVGLDEAYLKIKYNLETALKTAKSTKTYM